LVIIPGSQLPLQQQQQQQQDLVLLGNALCVILCVVFSDLFFGICITWRFGTMDSIENYGVEKDLKRLHTRICMVKQLVRRSL
jgi:hypothetical protein